jgi:hypothetical protein
MISLISNNNYIIFVVDGKEIQRLKNKVEFQLLPDGKYNVAVENDGLFLQNKTFEDFGFDTLDEFQEFISVNTGDCLTGEQKIQTALLELIESSRLKHFQIDAGGRTRVSQITTLLAGKLLGSDDTDLFENVGTGTANYLNNKVTLSVTAGQYMIRQSKRFCPYFEGKSQLIETTNDNFQFEDGIIKRIGYFSSDAVAPYENNFDGFFFESNGITNEFRFKMFFTGTPTLDVDLTETIGDYDLENFSVEAVDFLWLGGALSRAFLKMGANFELLNQFNYAGTSKDTFMLSPNQPIRYEIRSTTGVGSLRYICSQVATEGSFNEAGKTLSLYNSPSITTNTVNTIFALKGVKKQATFRDTAVQILDVSVGITASTDAGILMLIVNPTLSAPLTYVNKSKIQEGTATNQTITAGTGRVVCALPINVAGSTDIIKENFLSFLSGSINNTMDEYVLAYMPTTNNQSVNGVITIKEY